MKEIPLTQGKVAIVDDEDFDFLNQWKWRISKKGYAVRGTTKNGLKTEYKMHRVINKTPNGFETDHINRDKLDNRKANLRTASNSQNSCNQNKYKCNTSGYKGVHYQSQTRCGKAYSYWRAQIRINQKLISVGAYPTKEEAALAYNDAAIKYHGAFAVLNDIRFCYG